MGWMAKIIGYVTNNGVEVDANNQLLVRGAINPNLSGYAAMAGLIDAGTFTGTPRGKLAWVTEAGRVLVGQSSMQWDDTFNATAQNTAKYQWLATTQTGAQAGGSLVMNNGGITTINTNCGLKTYRTFPLFANYETRCIISGFMAPATTQVANNVIEFGLFQATLPGAAIPLDGVFFRYNAANELRGVINYNGTETQTAAITKPADNVAHDYMIICSSDVVTFWIDRQLRGVITLVTDAPTLGQPMMAAEVPLCVRQYIGGSAPASATKFQITDWYVTINGPEMSRLWQAVKAGMGHMAYQGQNGGTMGSTAQNANGAFPGAAVPTNTTAALGSGLGGFFLETATLAVTPVDGIISSFQVPAGGVNQTPRNLIVNGVTIDSFVSTVIAGGPFVAQWFLAFGHTAVSLATAESASFATPGTKAPRRLTLGQQAVTAAQAVSTMLARVTQTFQNPIVVAPGEFVQVCKRHTGTVGTSGVITHQIAFDAYYE